MLVIDVPKYDDQRALGYACMYGILGVFISLFFDSDSNGCSVLLCHLTCRLGVSVLAGFIGVVFGFIFDYTDIFFKRVCFVLNVLPGKLVELSNKEDSDIHALTRYVMTVSEQSDELKSEIKKLKKKLRKKTEKKSNKTKVLK